MKIRKSLYIVGLCGALLFGGLFVGAAQANEAGGAGDPLVTRSYVHQLLEEMLEGLAASESAGFSPVHVMMGHVLLGHEGTEVILRSGVAMANVPGADGLVDITAGEDLLHGAEILRNHMLIVPRQDGRGVWALSDAWFMVKGGFDIVAAP